MSKTTHAAAFLCLVLWPQVAVSDQNDSVAEEERFRSIPAEYYDIKFASCDASDTQAVHDWLDAILKKEDSIFAVRNNYSILLTALGKIRTNVPLTCADLFPYSSAFLIRLDTFCVERYCPTYLFHNYLPENELSILQMEHIGLTRGDFSKVQFRYRSPYTHMSYVVDQFPNGRAITLLPGAIPQTK